MKSKRGQVAPTVNGLLQTALVALMVLMGTALVTICFVTWCVLQTMQAVPTAGEKKKPVATDEKVVAKKPGSFDIETGVSAHAVAKVRRY